MQEIQSEKKYITHTYRTTSVCWIIHCYDIQKDNVLLGGGNVSASNDFHPRYKKVKYPQEVLLETFTPNMQYHKPFCLQIELFIWHS